MLKPAILVLFLFAAQLASSQQQPLFVQQKPKPLNIDYKMTSNYTAYPMLTNKKNGEYAGPENANRIKRIADLKQFAQNAFSLTINTTPVDTFNANTCGYKLFVSNTRKDTIRFNSYIGRLFMKLEALDKDGKWKSIEHIPDAWCGVSFHSIELIPGTCMEFRIPQFEGSMQTKIRAVLYYKNKNDLQNELAIYSNTINATINPGQFWRTGG